MYVTPSTAKWSNESFLDEFRSASRSFFMVGSAQHGCQDLLPKYLAGTVVQVSQFRFNMGILEYNGAAIIAMAGKDCVGIAADRRLGAQLHTVATDFTKVFPLNSKLYVGLGGLATDVQTLHQLLEFRRDLYLLKEEREMSPKVLSHLLSQMLYEKRFGPYFCEPVVAGLDEEGKPFLSSMDLIGAPVHTKDFVVTGTCTGNMYGMCETLFKPDLGPDELFETLAQALLSSVDRDALSGWGGIVHIITKDNVITRELKGRMD